MLRSLSSVFLGGLALLLLLQVNNTFAQVTVTGTVVDNEGAPLPSATVLVLDPADSSMIKGGITDKSGTYSLTNVSNGEYVLSVSMVGFRKHYTSTFQAGQQQVRLDTIRLEQAVKQLGEVAVEARKPLYEQKIDRLVVNVQQSVTSAGNTALEVLEKSPGVIINRQNNSISLRGQSDVLVMINDKIQRLPSDAIIQMLNGMNSSNIKEIELISSPPAKYEAEGVGGIIKIKMKKGQTRGYNGTVGGNLGHNGAETFGGHLNFNYRQDRLSVFVNYSINYDRTRHIWSSDRRITREHFTSRIKSTNQRHPKITVQNARAGLKYNLTRKTSVGLVLTGYSRLWKTRDISNFLHRAAIDSSIQTEMTVRETNRWQNAMANLSLDHQFSDKHNLSLDFDYLYYINDNPSFYQNEFIQGDRDMMGKEAIDVAKETPISIRVGKADYKYKLSEDLTFETGIKGTWSRFDNEVKVSDKVDGTWNVNSKFTHEADLDEKIAAAYVSGNWNARKGLNIKGGIRYEYTDSYLSTPSQPGLVDRQYGHFFPSLHIKQKLGEHNSLKAAYYRRITRPTYNDLAPWVFFLNPKYFITGNSSLQPAISNGIQLNYQHSEWLVSLEFDHTSGAMRRLPDQDEKTGTQTATPQNIDYERTYSLSLNIPLEIAPWWQLRTNVSGVYLESRISYYKTDLAQNTPYFRTRVTNTMELPADFVFEISGMYQSKKLAQSPFMGYQKPLGAVNAGIQKQIFDGQGTLELSANDIFSTNVWGWVINIPDENINGSGKYDFHAQSVALTFSWSFGDNDIDEVNVKTGSEEEQDRVNTN